MEEILFQHANYHDMHKRPVSGEEGIWSVELSHGPANQREPLKLAIGIPLLQSSADFDRTISSLTSVPGNVGDKVNEKTANILNFHLEHALVNKWTPQQKVQCVLWLVDEKPVTRVQRRVRRTWIGGSKDEDQLPGQSETVSEPLLEIDVDTTESSSTFVLMKRTIRQAYNSPTAYCYRKSTHEHRALVLRPDRSVCCLTS
ncbi:hypothetical protein ANN_05735 [Periplaneta americana]|uniref:Uncharacterized protein n=1 Tax=Periplaneta americana TaxID=6978 RepID=A0ABQ8TCX4_PERAM|nr:hypothetical protein ANN_05735 [Periplaneta americana]